MKRQRGIHRLRAKDLEALPAGDHQDGGGLQLRVVDGSRRWVQRLTISGRRINRGLGPYPLISLEMARHQSMDMRRAARDGKDLAREKRLAAAKATTFRQAFEAFFENKAKELKGSRHLQQWPYTMKTYVLPKIGTMPVGEVSHADVIEVLKPIWFEMPETARRVLQRMRTVFDSAIRRGQRDKANPCDGITQELGPRHQDVEHHRAMPYAEVADFIRMLRSSSARSALAFEWLILTATRSGETRQAVWAEIDEERALWTIPAKRMKMKRPHQIPLSHRCLEILRELRRLHPSQPHRLLFPGMRGRPMSDMTFTKVLRDKDLADNATVHGFRSTFKVWCAEVAKVRDEVSEAALAHSVPGSVRAAYLRTEFLAERVSLMQLWADYCSQGG